MNLALSVRTVSCIGLEVIFRQKDTFNMNIISVTNQVRALLLVQSELGSSVTCSFPETSRKVEDQSGLTNKSSRAEPRRRVAGWGDDLKANTD